MRPIVFWGATGQAKVLRECISTAYEVVALFDNNEQVGSSLAGVPIFHGNEGFKRWRTENPADDISFLVAIGGDRGHERLQIHEFLVGHGLQPATAIHESAFVALDAELGEGCQILAQAAVCAEARLGRETIINTAASVDHECRIGHGVHVAPGARLAGEVTVGDGTMIGIGAIVLPRVTIGSNVVVGAGSVVLRDVRSDCTVFGNPARMVQARPKPG
jgi:sugar O-acyltransferase (sialic acid O-acetyltransferase NeuD family)